MQEIEKLVKYSQVIAENEGSTQINLTLSVHSPDTNLVETVR